MGEKSADGYNPTHDFAVSLFPRDCGKEIPQNKLRYPAR